MFDCFDGTLFAYFKNATGMTEEPPAPPTRTITEIIDDIWHNRDRQYNVRCLVKRLQRIDKEMSGEARAEFARYFPDGDLASVATNLPQQLKANFTATMNLLREPAVQKLLMTYQRKQRVFLVSNATQDEVSSAWVALTAKNTSQRTTW